MAKMTEAEKVYTAMTDLMSGGTSMADAVRKVGANTGKKEGAIRANYYNHKKKLDVGATTTGRRGGPKAEAMTVDGALAQARALLEQVVTGIDRQLDDAKAELDAAQTRYDQLAESGNDRKAELQQKIKALS